MNKKPPQKPDERTSSIMRRPTLTSLNGAQRLGYPITTFNNNNHQNNGNVNNNNNNNIQSQNNVNGQGISGTSSPNTNFIYQEQVESSVTFRDGNVVNVGGTTGNGVAKDNNGGTITTTVKKQNDDCISSGRFYLHDSTWHPIIGPFGPMECVVCKCNQGEIECNRLKCPHKRELSCSKPVKVEGHCCPICITDKDQIVVPEGSSMCVSAKQDITGYKSQGFGTNGTEFIEFAFLKQLKTSPGIQIELHEWTLNNGDINAFTTDYLSMSQFDTLRNRQTFILLGATNEKNVEKFTRREKKLEKRCSSRCSIRISSLERSLRLHRLISRSQCLLHERLVAT